MQPGADALLLQPKLISRVLLRGDICLLRLHDRDLALALPLALRPLAQLLNNFLDGSGHQHT